MKEKFVRKIIHSPSFLVFCYCREFSNNVLVSFFPSDVKKSKSARPQMNLKRKLTGLFGRLVSLKGAKMVWLTSDTRRCFFTNRGETLEMNHLNTRWLILLFVERCKQSVPIDSVDSINPTALRRVSDIFSQSIIVSCRLTDVGINLHWLFYDWVSIIPK